MATVCCRICSSSRSVYWRRSISICRWAIVLRACRINCSRETGLTRYPEAPRRKTSIAVRASCTA